MVGGTAGQLFGVLDEGGATSIATRGGRTDEDERA